MVTAGEPTSKPLSESDFLADQADKAKDAAFAALDDAKVALQQSLDVRPTVKRHPLIALAAAGLVGFVATTLTVPSKEEQRLRLKERLYQARHPQPAASAASNGNGKSNGTPPPPHSIWSSIIHEIVQLIRPILLTAITTGIKSATNATPPDPARGDQN